VEAVCAADADTDMDILEALTVLVDHSLVKQNSLGTESRIVMLETIREFAYEQLEQSGELEQIEKRHTAAFLALTDAAEPNLIRKGRGRWLDRLEVDIDNLRTVLSRLIGTGAIGSAQHMVGILWRFWQMRGYIKEGRNRAAEVLSYSGGDPAQRVAALHAAGGMAYWQGDMKTMQGLYGEALELARTNDDPRTLVLALYNDAFPAAMLESFDKGWQLLEEGLELAKELGDSSLIGEILWGFGTVLWFVDRHEEALPWYDRSLEALEGSDSVFVVAWAHHMRGLLRTEKKDFAGARADLQISLGLFAEDDDLSGMVLSLNHFSDLALGENDVERALRLAGAAAKAQEISETGMLEIVQNRIPGLSEAGNRVGRERAEELLAEGRAMPLKQAIAYALEVPEKVMT
jgi:non-specific serine/threonine protein kinase